MSRALFNKVGDPGHTILSRNQSPCGQHKEAVWAQAIVDRLEARYANIPQIAYHKTKEFDDTSVGLAARVKVANDLKADMFSSHHTNAFGAWGEWTSPRGFGVYVHVNATRESKRLAEIAHANCRKFLLSFGLPDRGIRYRDLYVINPRYIFCPAILYEWAFHSNKDDVKLLLSQEYQLACMEVSMRTDHEYLGVKYMEVDELSAEKHIVEAGQTMYRTSRNHDMPLQELIDLNPQIDVPEKIEIGEVVFLTQPGPVELDYARRIRKALFMAKDLRDKLEEVEEKLADAISADEKAKLEQEIVGLKDLQKQVAVNIENETKKLK